MSCKILKRKSFKPRKLQYVADRIAKKFESIPLSKIQFPSEYRLGVTGITQSLLSTFLRCRYCFLLSLNCYDPVDARNTTAFGSLIHEILDKIYNFSIVNKGRVPPEFLIVNWVKRFHLESPEEFQNIKEQDVEIMLGVASLLLCEYVIFYKDDFVDKNWEAVEQVGSTMFFGSLLRRKIDGKFRINGKKWLLETKTMARIELGSLLLKLTFDFQNLFYVICEEENDPGDTVDGVLYNIIRNPSTKPKAEEPLNEFFQRLRKEVQKKPKYYFLRYEIPYTYEDKQVFRSELREILEEVAHVLGGIMPVYKNPLACQGRFTCDYLPICSSGKISGYKKRKFLFPELNLEI